MRKLFLLGSLGTICLLISCNSATVDSASMNSETQKNLEAAHAIDDAFKTGDVSKIDNYVAADFIDHTEHGEVKGVDSLKAMIKMVHDSFKNMKMNMIKEMADGDYVFSWMEFTGNNPQPTAMGMPAGPYDMHGMEMAKFKNGKCIEHWEYDDPGEIMKMMGQMNEGNKMSMDSSKMNDK